MWKKKGLLFNPHDYFKHDFSHASIPTPINIEGDLFRIFFAARDKKNVSHIFYIDAELHDGNVKLLPFRNEIVLSPGELGLFDEHGVMPSVILKHRNIYHLYYIGWQRLYSVPFNTCSGLAISDDLKNFQKISRAPIIDRTHHAPFINASPFILYENRTFRMWHTGGVKWIKTAEGVKHFYNIRYSVSKDGIDWEYVKTAIDFAYPEEYAIARPVVIKESGKYKMWYSFRASPYGKTYRIGYAESNDGINWIRMDNKVGIDVSENGWDSKMICYAYVLIHKGIKYMFYNGNGYGKTGFGYAIWEE